MATVTKSIGTTGRDYSTITAWEADLDNDTPYDAGDDVVGECYNDSAFDEKFSIDGGSTLGLASIKLTVASAERHDGTAGTGVVLDVTSTSNVDIVQLKTASSCPIVMEWFEVTVTGGACNDTFVEIENPADPDYIHFRNGIVHGAVTASFNNTNTALIKSSNSNNHILNNICYDVDTSDSIWRDPSGIYQWTTAADDVFVYNNTVHDITAESTRSAWGYRLIDDAQLVVKNCIATSITGGSANECFDLPSPASTVMSHNLSSDTTASGTGSLTSKTAANQFVSIVGGSEDLHLKSGADAIDAGTDLGTTPSGVEIDIDGTDRDATGATWDMGAHELVVAATAHYPRNVNFYRGMLGMRNKHHRS